MGNAKDFAVARKHRQKRRAAKQKVRDFLRTKSGGNSSMAIASPQ